MKAFVPVLAGLCGLALLCVVGCDVQDQTMVILSGSENEPLEPMVQEFARSQGFGVRFVYQGSVDIMMALGQDGGDFDAIWPANSLWIALGDSQRRVKHTKSIMTSPVIFGIKESRARQLGLDGPGVKIQGILEAVKNQGLRFMMTSATQSNSGASAYLGFLYALAGNPETLTLDHLADPELQKNIRSILGGINRSSGSSGWLKDLFLSSDYEALVNYESVLIEINQELETQGRETLHFVYPMDGISMADSPLGFIDRGIEGQEDRFLQLQQHLLGKEAQTRIQAAGRRTGLGGGLQGADPQVFKPRWGIEADRILVPFRTPDAPVIREALRLYQDELRKPSATVFCLDYSGSMSGSGEAALEQAMSMLLDPVEASRWMIQTGEGDLTWIMPFNHEVLGVLSLEGNKAQDLAALENQVTDLVADGGTDIFTPAYTAIHLLRQIPDLAAYNPAVILLTDGRSDGAMDETGFTRALESLPPVDIPVFSITFGDADTSQLKVLADLTRGRVFNGTSDLIKAFRQARGYN